MSNFIDVYFMLPIFPRITSVCDFEGLLPSLNSSCETFDLTEVFPVLEEFV
jgi:hypothetical protein